MLRLVVWWGGKYVGDMGDDTCTHNATVVYAWLGKL